MTREEAIKRIDVLKFRCERLGEKWIREWKMDAGALDLALSALRPVSREQVEQMRGEWISTGAISCKCSKCNKLELKFRADECNFCPHCMAPMTDEAVEMVMKRWEALYDTKN